MSTPTNPKKDPLSSLFAQSPQPVADTGASETPEPGNFRAPRPVSRPMPPPVIPPSPSAGPDPRALAKALAKAAVAKAGAPAPRPEEAAPAAQAQAAEAKPVVRGVAAAPPPVRKLSAMEAMDLARKQESERAAAAAAPAAAAAAPAPAAPPAAASRAVPVAIPAAAVAAVAAVSGAATPVATQPVVAEDQLGDTIQGLLGASLPGAQIYIANAMFASDRKALTALWRAHRARFLATHQIEYAVGSATVLHLLSACPADQLAMAHGVTDKGEFLIWVDLSNRSLVTAFANPKQLIAGW